MSSAKCSIMNGMFFRVLAALALVAGSLAAQAPKAPVSLSDLLDDLVIANHILANENVLDGYGHVSVRSPVNPNHYFLAKAEIGRAHV